MDFGAGVVLPGELVGGKRRLPNRRRRCRTRQGWCQVGLPGDLISGSGLFLGFRDGELKRDADKQQVLTRSRGDA